MAFEPSASAAQICWSPVRSDVKTIRSPRGEYSALESRCVLWIRGRPAPDSLESAMRPSGPGSCHTSQSADESTAAVEKTRREPSLDTEKGPGFSPAVGILVTARGPAEGTAHNPCREK